MTPTDVLSLIWSSIDRLGFSPILIGMVLAFVVIGVVAFLIQTLAGR